MNNDRALRREARRRDNPWAGLVIGSAILAYGVIAWLDHLGRIDGDDYLRWWPVALIAMAIAHLLNRQWIGAIIWFVIGVAFMPYLNLNDVLGVWPLLISAGGITLIRQALNPLPKDQPNRGSFRALAWMGGSGRTVNSPDFVGGDVVVVMGACELNLVNSKITHEAVVDVLAFWGGVEIWVPPDWVIENRVLPILGGVTNRAANPTSGDGPRLIIRGSAIMGGVEIRNPKEMAA